MFRNIRINTKTVVGVVLTLLTIAIVALFVIIIKQPIKTTNKVQKQSEAESIKNNKEVDPINYTVSKIEDYVSYVIKYVDKQGKNISMINDLSLIKLENTIYPDIISAKENGIIKDYYESYGEIYFQLKIGARLAWKVTPINTDTIENWNDAKEKLMLSVQAENDYNNKIIERIIEFDYSQEIAQITYSEEIK